MEDSDFWLRIWTIAACVLIVVIFTTAVVSLVKGYVLSKSDDPIALSCSLSGSSHSQQCAIVMARGAHK